MSQRLSWVGVLLIAIISGLVIKIVGDPIVEITTPAIADFFDDMGDRFEDTMENVEDSFEGDRNFSDPI
ncbi:hypothetical protein H6G89_09295 [Oscillatoria sp. FACHB-1407]|uniref:hypothetical protein n=1 Tax=Oscillatoria sp. FACHB-1407 TaxID=2692847 RepID=UPI001685A8E0|nr:hypothetical protein [Oscillatoria sp. FACHB-1407]MBD2461239.1 hypothetical protein [Oscillatoria sp. FACHB-1407]